MSCLCGSGLAHARSGTIIPWSAFNDVAQNQEIWRFVVIGLLIILFRRLPMVLLTWKLTPDIHDWREAFFTGWFGPVRPLRMCIVDWTS
jgi:NhaP-type Na+/H+ or K+/H+ antiporter